MIRYGRTNRRLARVEVADQPLAADGQAAPGSVPQGSRGGAWKGFWSRSGEAAKAHARPEGDGGRSPEPPAGHGAGSAQGGPGAGAAPKAALLPAAELARRGLRVCRGCRKVLREEEFGRKAGGAPYLRCPDCRHRDAVRRGRSRALARGGAE